MRRKGCKTRLCHVEAKASSERKCDAPHSISGGRRHVAHCSGLQRRPACFQWRPRPTWTARPKRGPGPPGTAGATGSGGHARASGPARSRFANPDHPCELRAAVVHRPMRAGRGACHSLLRHQKEAGHLPHGHFGVMRDHSESGRQSAGRSLREGNEPVMRPRLIAQANPGDPGDPHPDRLEARSASSSTISAAVSQTSSTQRICLRGSAIPPL